MWGIRFRIIISLYFARSLSSLIPSGLAEILQIRNKVVVALACLLTAVISGCEQSQEDIQSEYPIITTLGVTEINAEGVRFNGRFASLGTSVIVDYGFLWSNHQGFDISNSNKVVLHEVKNSFSARIESTLKPSVTYYVRAFATTETSLVYGDRVEFRSQGSKGPEIHSFFPASGSWGDTLTILGNNFSYLKKENICFLGSLKMEALSATDSLLRFLIIDSFNEKLVNLHIETTGMRATASEKFLYKSVSLPVQEPIAGAFSDTLSILVTDYNSYYLSLRMEMSPVKVVSMEDDIIHFVVPNSLVTEKPNLTIISADEAIVFKDFSLKMPIIETLDKNSSHYGDTITMEGLYLNPDLSYNAIKFNGIPGQVINSSRDKVSVIVPNELDQEVSDINYVTGPFDNTVGTFTLLLPEAISLYPDPVSEANGLLIIKGKNFNLNADLIELTVSHPEGSFVADAAEILDIRSTEITLQLDKKIFRNLRMSVIGKFGITLKTFDFPPTFTTGDIRYQSTWTRKNTFPGSGRGHAISFSISGVGYFGTGYSGALHGELKDFWKYNQENDSWTRIDDLPGNPRMGAVAFVLNGFAYVGLGGDKYSSGFEQDFFKDFYRLDPSTDKWTRIGDFPGVGRSFSTSFVVSGNAYIGTGYWDDNGPTTSQVSSDFWKYDSSTDTWVQVTSLPHSSQNARGFTIEDNAYVFVPDSFGNIFRYSNNEWILDKSAKTNARRTVAFVLDNKVYIGLGIDGQVSGTSELWELDMNTGISTNLPIDGRYTQYGGTAFIIGSQAYIVGQFSSGIDVWEFDPSKPN